MEPTDVTTPALTSSREAWLIPGAIVIAGAILAIALYNHRVNAIPGTAEGDVSMVRPVSPDDHIIGNPEASVTLITYADIDSSHAKTFNATLEQLMSEYAPEGKVAWVYRHLPLIDQHVYAAQHAQAAECAASLGGPAMFWRFIDTLNAQAPGTQQFNPRDYPALVTALGLLPQSFEQCMTDRTFEKRVADDFTNGMAAGAGGSPFSVLLVKGLPPVTIDGAVPYDDMKRILDEAVARVQ